MVRTDIYLCWPRDEGGCGFVDRESEFHRTSMDLTCPICHKEETVFLVATEVKLSDVDELRVALRREMYES